MPSTTCTSEAIFTAGIKSITSHLRLVPAPFIGYEDDSAGNNEYTCHLRHAPVRRFEILGFVHATSDISHSWKITKQKNPIIFLFYVLVDCTSFGVDLHPWILLPFPHLTYVHHLRKGEMT